MKEVRSIIPGRRRRFSKKFKDEVVERSKTENIRALAKELNIEYTYIYIWRKLQRKSDTK